VTDNEPTPRGGDVQSRLDELSWYHTIDVIPGATTKGWFDLRHALDLIPWPDVKGKRCLDIGTWDGFYAYEMERRGAAEVVAVDLADLAEMDYPPDVRARADFDLSHSDSQERSAGFRLLNQILDSSVRWHGASIYSLDPSVLGTFDVVVCGSLLVHLRDPIRALEAVRRVTSGVFLSVDYIHPAVNLFARRRPLFELRAQGSDFQWWLASDRGLQHLIHVAGFDVEAMSRPFLLRPGPYTSVSRHGLHDAATRLLHRFWAGDSTRGGHLHRAYLARPRF
jgi:tRNA (mo5U34)-methyltransferase